MKKYVLSIFMIAVGLFSTFAQNNEELDSFKNEENKKELSISLLNEKYIMNVQDLLSNASYQNPNGEKIKHSEVNKMLLTVPENKTFMKRCIAWTVVTYVLLGVACAGITTNVVYTFNENLPYQETISSMVTYGTLFSIFGAFFTSSIAGSNYKIAIDNYNLDLLGINGK